MAFPRTRVRHRRPSLTLPAALLAGALAVVLAAVPPSPPPAAAAVPELRVSTVVAGLSQPWDVEPLPDGSLLVTERTSKRLLHVTGGTARPVSYPSGSVWAAGETGLMSLAVDPAFASNRRFYTCHGGYAGSRRDVRVVAWRLAADASSATRVRDLVTGIPATTGRHGGCRLLVARDGALLVGTGDAARGDVPRDLRSLGGKVLRVNRATGAPMRDNPYVKARSRAKRLVLTRGHRNVQGLAQRADGRVFSVEHGTSRDDEVNLLVRGGDYGWHPGPSYDERRPMTDHRLKGRQRSAVWRSGAPTIATSGADFVRGTRWGDLDGTLAVAALKGERVVFMRFGPRGRLLSTTTPPELRSHGRLRSVTSLPSGDLLVTTARGTDDRVLRVTPVG